MIPSNVVFATLVCMGRHEDPGTSLSMTENWVRQLQYYGIPLEQQLLIASTDLKPAHARRAQRLGTQIMFKDPIETPNGRREEQTIKLHLWNLTMYDRVVYYNSDFIFPQSPVACYDLCPNYATLCAVADDSRRAPWTSLLLPYKWRNFYTDFMIIKPSAAEFKWLYQHTKAARTPYVEQHYLNNEYRSRVQHISPSCNVNRAKQTDFTDPNAIALRTEAWNTESMVWIAPHIRARIRLVPQFANPNSAHPVLNKVVTCCGGLVIAFGFLVFAALCQIMLF